MTCRATICPSIGGSTFARARMASWWPASSGARSARVAARGSQARTLHGETAEQAREVCKPDPRARYVAQIRQLLGPQVAKYQKLIAKEVAADNKKFYPSSAFSSNEPLYSSPEGCAFWAEALCGSAPSIPADAVRTEARAARSCEAVAHTQAAASQAAGLGECVCGSGALGEVRLYRSSRGAFIALPMFDDGLHHHAAAADGVYGQALLGQAAGVAVEYFCTPQNTSGVLALLPERGGQRPAGYQVLPALAAKSLVINEFMADNASVIQDEKKEFDDWIEVDNASKKTLVLTGKFLSDDPLDLRKWKFPAAQSLAPSGRLLVWADNDLADGPLHCKFKLSKKGEQLLLVDSDGTTILDQIIFGAQSTDHSSGRLFDGKEPWVEFLGASPRRANAPLPGKARGYSAFVQGRNRAGLGMSTAPRLGASLNFRMTNGVPSDGFALFLTATAARVEFSGFEVLVGSPSFVLVIAADGSGASSLPLSVPRDRGLLGKQVYAQAFGFGAGKLLASNALELSFGP